MMNLKNVNFPTKFLLFLAANNQEEGKIWINTTLVLTVSIIIFHYLEIITLPVFSDMFLIAVINSKNADGKSYISATVRAQQAYRLESTYFGPTFKDLKIGLPTQTANFAFFITSGDAQSATVIGIATDSKLKSFAGQVIVDTTGTKSINCQTNKPSSIPPIPDAANQKCITGEPMK